MSAETLGQALTLRGRDADNNFLLLRLFAATAVIYGHSFALAAPCPSCIDVVQKVFPYRYAGDVGLHVFFVISGFLVTASFDARRSVAAFLWARALRLWPALIVFCLLVALALGPAFTTLSLAEYLSAKSTRDFLATNASLLGYSGDLPGVFEANRYTSAAGTLWTLWVEARLYLMIAIAGAFGCLSRWWGSLIVILLVGVGLAAPQLFPLIGGGYADNLRLAALFGVGVLAYLHRNALKLSWPALGVLLLAAYLSQPLPSSEIVFGAALSYAVLMVAFAPKVRLPGFVQDYSYGIYLYGWPIQQLVALLWPDAGPYKMAVIAIPAAWVAGAASWHLIEKRALRLKSRTPSSITRREETPAPLPARAN